MISTQFDVSRLTEGIQNIANGYVDYAKEVITNRAVPSLKDGLKPVNRRTLYTMYKNFPKDKVKSADVVGRVMKLHPHGDSSIYSALILLTDKNGTSPIPLLNGQGNLGLAISSAPPAAYRYTEVALHENAKKYYFGEMDGIEMLPSYDGSTIEPEAFPVCFPAVLCSPQSGIAVGFRSSFPSFNLIDVLDLTIEYLRTGECKTVIYPDFPTGGYLVKDAKEGLKLMTGGKASFHVRAKILKDNGTLRVVEFPSGVTVESIRAQLNKLNIDGLKAFADTTSYTDDAYLTIDTVKSKTDSVLYSLYKNTKLQTKYSAELLTILDDSPVLLGVWGIIAEWVKWRRSVVLKQFKKDLEGTVERSKLLKAFNLVFNDTEAKEKVVDLILHDSRRAATDYIQEHFNGEIDAHAASWVIKLGLDNYNDGGSYITEYAKVIQNVKSLEDKIANVDEVIISQLLAMKEKEADKHQRRTELTNTNYEFANSNDDDEVKDETFCYYSIKDGFLKKSRFAPTSSDMCVTALACDTLIAIDNRGRVIRIYGEEYPYSSGNELGEYIPKYFGLDEGDDYRVIWLSKLEPVTKMLIYNDGNVGFLDMTEWTENTRRVKVIEKGIAVESVDNLCMITDVPECFFVIDSNGKLGCAYTDKIKRKHRTAKTRVFNIDKGQYISSIACMSEVESLTFVRNVGRYVVGEGNRRLQYLESAEDFTGSEEAFVSVC